MDEWCRISVIFGGSGHPDLTSVDRLGRLLLAAGRAGASVQIDSMSPEMMDLLDLVGLRVEVGGEAEVLEETTGFGDIEKEGHLGDPAV